MISNITFSEFRDAFQNVRPDNFTYLGQRALFDYLTQWEDDTGENMELDVIAFCCEFTEYEDIEHAWADYNIAGEDGTDLEREEFRCEYIVAEFCSGVIVRDH